MRRRGFLEMAAAAAAAQAAAAPARGQAGARRTGRPSLMKLGTQHGDSDEVLKVMAAFGVNHICSTALPNRLDEQWSVEGLVKRRERVESYGIKLDMVPLPTNADITGTGIPNVMLGKSPERDREIDMICQIIRNVARAGIPAVKYNLIILGVIRTGWTPGRGGASYNTFDYAKASQDERLTVAGRVTADMFWERITYFLERVVPVAEEYKVKMALHPHDPPAPPGKGLRGVDRVLGSVEGLKRFISIRPSPYHGLNFCQGTVCEMLANPGKEIFEVIRYFGSRKKIFNVHLRNIKGGFLKFQETFPDDGDINMLEAVRTYKQVGYDGMLMPDHAPRITGDERGRQAFAFAFGYIQALLQMVNSEA